MVFFFFFQAEDGIRDKLVTGVQTCALPISRHFKLHVPVRESGYEHPHGHVKLEVPGKTWHVVLAPPTRMEHRGLSSSMLAVGTQATVVGYPHRTDPGEMRAERITIDGKTIELR